MNFEELEKKESTTEYGNKIEEQYFKLNDEKYCLRKEKGVCVDTNKIYPENIENQDMMESIKLYRINENGYMPQISFYLKNENKDDKNDIKEINNLKFLSEDLKKVLSNYIPKEIIDSGKEGKISKNKIGEVISFSNDFKNWSEDFFEIVNSTFENKISAKIDSEGLINLSNEIRLHNLGENESENGKIDEEYSKLIFGVIKLKNEKAVDEMKDIFNKNTNKNFSKEEFIEASNDPFVLFDQDDRIEIQKVVNEYVNSKIDFEKTIPTIKNENAEYKSSFVSEIFLKSFDNFTKEIEKSELFKKSTHKRKIVIDIDYNLETPIPILDQKYDGNYFRINNNIYEDTDYNTVFSYNKNEDILKISSQYITGEYQQGKIKNFYFEPFEDYSYEKKSKIFNVFSKIQVMNKENLENIKEGNILYLENGETICNNALYKVAKENINNFCDSDLKTFLNEKIDNINERIDKQNEEENKIIPEILENFNPFIPKELMKLEEDEYTIEDEYWENEDDDLMDDFPKKINLVIDEGKENESLLQLETKYNKDLDEEIISCIEYFQHDYWNNSDYDYRTTSCATLFDNGESYTILRNDSGKREVTKNESGLISKGNKLNLNYLNNINDLLDFISSPENIKSIKKINNKLVVNEYIGEYIKNFKVTDLNGETKKLKNIFERKGGETLSVEREAPKINSTSKKKNKEKKLEIKF